jgi:hypothetical protein
MMKRILLILALTASGTAFAQHNHYGHGYWRHDGRGGWGWVAPAVIGGVIVYEATRPPVVVQQPAPVIIQQQPGPICSPWTEVQNPDGTITRTRTCTQ